MAWLDGLGSGLVSGIASIFGGIQQNRMIDKQIAAQKEENALNRAYNKELAAYQNRMNVAQWQRENEYNSPENQMKRLQAAGLNPDLMYQSGASGLTAASSPAMTAGAASSPTDVSNLANKKTVGQIVTEGLDNAQRAANIALTRAQANKTDAETTGQNLKNQNILALDQAELSKLYSEADLNKKQIEVADANIAYIQQKGAEIAENINLIIAKTNDITVQQQFKRFELALKSKEVNAVIDKLAAETGFTREQLRQMVDLFPYVIQQTQANIAKTNAEVDQIFMQTFLTQLMASHEMNKIKLTREQTRQIKFLADILEPEAFNKQCLYALTKNSPGWNAFWQVSDIIFQRLVQALNAAAGVAGSTKSSGGLTINNLMNPGS